MARPAEGGVEQHPGRAGSQQGDHLVDHDRAMVERAGPEVGPGHGSGRAGGQPIRSPSTSVPSGFLPDRAEWKRAEKGTSTLPVEGLRMSRPEPGR